MKKPRIFLDCDVILDLLTEREPHFKASLQLFVKVQNKEVMAYTSPVVIANIFYILNRHFDRKKSIQSLIKLKSLIKILSCGDKEIELALSSDFKDFEDSIQYYTALQNGIDTLITRNTKDYKTAKINILTSIEFINSY